MRHTFSVGVSEIHSIEIRYDRLLAFFSIYVDNERIIHRWLGLDFRITVKYEFGVGVNEKHHLRITKKRPAFNPGFNPHIYAIWIDEQIVDLFHA